MTSERRPPDRGSTAFGEQKRRDLPTRRPGEALPVSGILLAAGLSQRVEDHKLLLPWGGVTLLRHAVRAFVEAGLREVIVVVNQKTRRGLPSWGGFRAVSNHQPERGQGSSLSCGVRAASRRSEALLVGLADLPGVTSAHIRCIAEQHFNDPERIHFYKWGEARGHPVVFPASLREELEHLEGEAGGRAAIERHPELATPVPAPGPEVIEDIDSKEDYQRLLSAHEAAQGKEP